jgi:hypothetical protein
MRDALGEKDAGEGGVGALDLRRRALREDGAAMHAGPGPEVDDAVGAPHEFVVMLDHEERVALGAQGLERGDEPVVVAGVQADGRLVEDVEHAGEIGAELRRQPDALGLAAGEGLGRPVEGQVTEADVVEEFQALLNLRQKVLRDQSSARVEVQGPGAAAGRPGCSATGPEG